MSTPLQKIRRLPPSIAERIAAGETIERPSSVVKELVENSLDAGATEVQVTLQDGGKGLIEVIDNGEGMLPEDLEISIERHATSKLSTLEDLDRIVTLGFRGEALPSIAAVSDLNVLSRFKDAERCYLLAVGDLLGRSGGPPRAEKFTFGQFINLKHGTRVQVRGLFSQIPARLKFLKSANAEVSQTRELLERLAIAYPHVGFKLLSGERTVLNLRPDTEAARIQAVLGEGGDYPVITGTNEQNGYQDLGLRIRVSWLQGLSSPQSRKLVQIVNSRIVRDRMLQQAILSPFRQALLPGQFPAVALMIDVHPAAIDVNVHPTKSEIRFLNSSKIFSTLDTLIKSMIAREGAPSISPAQFQESHTPSLPTPPWKPSLPPPQRTSYESGWKFSEPQISEGPTEQIPFEIPSHLPPSHGLDLSRPRGILFHTYLLFEGQGEMILIDQHAADERIRYEKLKKRVLGISLAPGEIAVASQSLFVPETVKFSPEWRGNLETHFPTLTRLGFDVEFFGEDTLLFRSIPSEWGTAQPKMRLRNLVDRLLHFQEEGQLSSTLSIDERVFESIASEACHSAIRAHDRLEPEEARALVDALFRCEHPWNCPHGRPTVAKIPEAKVEEWFQRRV